MKDRGSHRTIAIVLTLGAGLALVLAGRGLGAGGQPQPRPHAPLTMEQRLARSAYWASKRGLQFGIPAGAYEHAVRDAKALPAVEAATPGVLAWNAIGPQPMLKNRPNFGGVFTGPALNTSEGRVSAVAADPTTRNLVYVGAAGGGVWRSTDGGGTFTPVFDGNPTQAIGAITVDHRGNVWVGTGEGVESDSYYGQGIFKSSDHGSTWTQLTGERAVRSFMALFAGSRLKIAFRLICWPR